MAPDNEYSAKTAKTENATAKNSIESLRLEMIDRTIALLRAATWPSIFLLVLCIYHGPFRRVADELPDLVHRATKISGGGLSMEIQAQAEQTGGFELASLLLHLAPEDVEKVIQTGTAEGDLIKRPGNHQISIPSVRDIEQLARLEAKQLLEATLDDRPIKIKEFESQFVSMGFERVNPHSDAPQLFHAKRSELNREQKLLTGTKYKLTPQGIKAYKAILEAITKELAKKHDV